MQVESHPKILNASPLVGRRARLAADAEREPTFTKGNAVKICIGISALRPSVVAFKNCLSRLLPLAKSCQLLFR